MKKISIWAKDHIWQTRLLIVIIYILLIGIGISTGKLLNELNVLLPQEYLLSCIIITFVLWTCYPSRNIKPVKSYRHRKFFDFSLGVVTFLMILFAGNTSKIFLINSESAIASKGIRIPKDSIANHPIIVNFTSGLEKMDVTKLSQKEKLRLIKKQIRTINNDKETSKTSKTLLIILSILIASGLLIGLAALSCSIACSSSGALAIIVALAGTFAILYFLIRIVKRISNPLPKTKEKGEPKSIPIP